MNPENILAGTASLFLALGDTTRLRLLNLMRDQEICVSSFTGILGQSQPLISRHLAYLRNSGLVEARRDGKWMYYSFSTKLDANTTRLMVELFHWMESQEGLQQDLARYQEAHPAGAAPTGSHARRAARGPLSPGRISKREIEARAKSGPHSVPEPGYESELETYLPKDDRGSYGHHSELTDPSTPRHNELEDFLL